MSGAWPLLDVGTHPPGWVVRRIGDLADLTNGYPFDSEAFGTEGVPLVRIRDIYLDEYTTYVSGVVPDSVVLKDGDVVIGMDGDFEVAVWKRGPAALNQRMCLLRGRDGTDSRFLAYILPRHLKVINDLTYATTVKHLSSFDVLAERVPAPPPAVQRAIADYLDVETARIDRMRALIDGRLTLLAARLTTMIREDLVTVEATRAPMRRFVSRVKTGGTPPHSDVGSVPWYTPTSLLEGLEIGPPVRLVPPEWLAAGSAVRFGPNSTLIVGIGATAGRVAFAEHESSGNQQLTCVEPGPALVPRFLAWQLWARGDELRGTASTTTLPIISNEVIRALPLHVPSISDQTWLVERWEETAAAARAMTIASNRLGALITERRQALITAAVTGQLEIPGVAA